MPIRLTTLYDLVIVSVNYPKGRLVHSSVQTRDKNNCPSGCVPDKEYPAPPIRRINLGLLLVSLFLFPSFLNLNSQKTYCSLCAL